MIEQQILRPTLRATFGLYARSFAFVAVLVALSLIFVEGGTVLRLVPLYALVVTLLHSFSLTEVRTKLTARIERLNTNKGPISVPVRRFRFSGPVGLQPYGTTLLSNVTALWINVARIVLVAIVSVEALALGYVGYISASHYRPIVGVGVAVVGALLIWALGVALLTLDSDLALSPAVASIRRISRRSFTRVRSSVAIVLRAALIFAAVFVTAPFLTQLILSSDISAAILRQNEQTIAATRATLVTNFDQQLRPLLENRAAVAADLEAQIRGGATGAVGYGPAADALRTALADIDRRIADVESSRRRELAVFDQAPPAVLRARYHVSLLGDDLISRATITAELLKTPTYRAVEHTVLGFLIGLFVALATLKVFQPRSVSVYYSEVLQELYRDYSAGLLDPLLSPDDRERDKIAPLRFAEWAVAVYSPLRREEIERRHLQTAVAIHRVRQESLKQLEAEIFTELDSIRRRRDELVISLAAVEEKLAELDASMTVEHPGVSGPQVPMTAHRSPTPRQLEYSRASALRPALARQRQAYLAELSLLDSAVGDKTNIVRELNGAIDASRREVAVGFR